MRTFAVFLAVVLAVSAKNIKPHDEEEITEAFIWCVDKALDGGLESAEIPNHNPLHIPRNLSYEFDQDVISGYFKADDLYLEGITVFDINSLEGHYTDDTESEIDFTYELYWPSMWLHGNYDADLEILGVSYNYKGTFQITLNHVKFNGVWNMATNPKELLNFTVAVDTESSDAEVTGAGVINDLIFGQAIGIGVQYLLDTYHDQIRDTASTFLQGRFNDFWLDADHLYRIDAIIENCQDDAAPKTHFTPNKVGLEKLFKIWA